MTFQCPSSRPPSPWSKPFWTAATTSPHPPLWTRKTSGGCWSSPRGSSRTTSSSFMSSPRTMWRPRSFGTPGTCATQRSGPSMTTRKPRCLPTKMPMESLRITNRGRESPASFWLCSGKNTRHKIWGQIQILNEFDLYFFGRCIWCRQSLFTKLSTIKDWNHQSLFEYLLWQIRCLNWSLIILASQMFNTEPLLGETWLNRIRGNK